MSYKVNVARQVLRDIDEAIFYKEKLGTYTENIRKFVVELDHLIYDDLAESPMIGVSLSSRLNVETSIRYQVKDDYILFYDVSKENQEVDVLRLLPAKSNWMTLIMKYF